MIKWNQVIVNKIGHNKIKLSYDKIKQIMIK